MSGEVSHGWKLAVCVRDVPRVSEGFRGLGLGFSRVRVRGSKDPREAKATPRNPLGSP